ncbi:MAG: alanine--tRNA ligase [Euryarchaeota archaeon]|nr:alanine--tRNA ligase [Euryarchaeota archaeon]
MLEAEYDLRYFKENGFSRRKCAQCNSYFWSQDQKRTLCGDPPCNEYTFIGAPEAKKPLDLREMRETFLRFFEAHGHTRVKRFPVVARWRDDIYLTIASIADFQPHVTSGEVPPPANPLCISQPCIRLNDVDSVGKSGRHLTNFEMMAHHAFNSKEFGQPYFKEECTKYCHEFLTKELGIPGASVTYKEKPWAGGGNAGAAFEVLVGGLEVATLVFMSLEADPAGPIELYGERYKQMDLKIVDTGYGLERLVWATTGSPTIYDAIYPDMVKRLVEKAGLSHDLEDPRHAKILSETARLASLMEVNTGAKVASLREAVTARLAERGVKTTPAELASIMGPLESIFAVIDHTRCVAFMLGDGIVPSNVKEGYLARLLIRRTLRLLDELGLDLTLAELIGEQLDSLSGDFPELSQARETILEMCTLEAERYRETMEKGSRLVEREAGKLKEKGFTEEKLIEFYDTHGLPPDIVSAVAREKGVKVEVPDDFYQRVAALHSRETATKPVKAKMEFPKTRLIYYESQDTREFEAIVLGVKNDEVVLDGTAFFAEKGGQPADHGFLSTADAMAEVKDVQIRDGVVVHTIEPKNAKVRRGEVVRGRVDWGRRTSHTRHHSATHILLASTRRVLGPHVWQAGVQKGAERSRLDVTHFRNISEEELREIEALANTVVLEGYPVEKLWLDRNEAEKRFGFQLYQGGIPPTRQVRVVKIGDFDVECCGGTHVKTTTEVGPIKILKAERIQDGIIRLEFSAGLAALRRIQEKDAILKEAAQVFDVLPEQLPKTAERFLTEWKELRKQVEALKPYAAVVHKQELLSTATTVGNVRLAVRTDESDMDDLVLLASEATKGTSTIVILGSTKGGAKIVVARSDDLKVNSGDVVREACKAMGGGGGGKPNLAQGGGPDASKLPLAMKRAEEVVRDALAKA